MELREQLLAAAVRVVTEQGWRGATTRRIAEAAGVNEVTLFRHFGSKDSLIREAMCWSAARAPIALLPDEPGDARRELMAWARQHYEHLIDIRGHIRRTIGEFELRPNVEDWPRRVPRHLAAMLEHYLERLRERGLTRGDWQPRAAASLLLGSLFADAISRDLIPDHLPSPAADAPRQYVELFLNAIGYEVSRS
jgi:AcrR family transcriptional regulator